jgi:hypothetical protein
MRFTNLALPTVGVGVIVLIGAAGGSVPWAGDCQKAGLSGAGPTDGPTATRGVGS